MTNLKILVFNEKTNRLQKRNALKLIPYSHSAESSDIFAIFGSVTVFTSSSNI